MVDGQTARTYAMLVLIVIVAPLTGIFASSVAARGRAQHPVSIYAAESRNAEARLIDVTPEPPRGDATRAAGDGDAAPAPAGQGAQPPDAASTDPAAGGEHSTPEAAQQPAAATAPPTPAPSLFSNAQVVAFYGTPRSSGLGVLGMFDPPELADWLHQEAGIYDQLNGDRGVVPALDLIYALVQSEPTDNGLYLSYLDDATVQSYIALAEQNDFQLILDLQVGRGDPVEEVRKVEPYLLNPRVHVAVDPEYAVGPDGVPIATPGEITGDQINAIQDYLGALVAARGLPPKIFVIHQFMENTVVGGDVTKQVPNVNLVLNMDAFGAAPDKQDKYRLFASRAYAHHRSFNVFLKQDAPVASEQEVMSLTPLPDMVIYQ
ncbi:MAG TPA: hypothetical protein VFC53_06080 [Dehalococcoidia bacterium]|nr:hypothetical protein [Dehalococcoidia bacterium]